MNVLKSIARVCVVTVGVLMAGLLFIGHIFLDIVGLIIGAVTKG